VRTEPPRPGRWTARELARGRGAPPMPPGPPAARAPPPGPGPEKVHDAAYAIPADDQGRPGRTLLLWNGDLVLTVSAYAPHGSMEHDVQKDLERIVGNAARLTEDGLRDHDASSAAP
ncbi:hypothetical protein ACFWJY_36870, partial [Streptomyces anulatus]